jgi:hypothetical protein
MRASLYVERAQSHEKLGRLAEAPGDFRVARGLDPRMPAASEGYTRIEAAFAASRRGIPEFGVHERPGGIADPVNGPNSPHFSEPWARAMVPRAFFGSMGFQRHLSGVLK